MWTKTVGQLAAAVCVLCVKQWHLVKALLRLELEALLVYLFTVALQNHPPPIYILQCITFMHSVICKTGFGG